MNIHHHLDEATIISYAAGALSQGMALAASCHISMCSHCQNNVMEAEAIGGVLLENIPLSHPITSADSTDKALQQALLILDQEPISELIDQSKNLAENLRKTEVMSEVPLPLSNYIGTSLDDIKWKKFTSGFLYFDIFLQRPGMCRLLKLSPGKCIFPHSHHGSELTLLLRGSFFDEMGCYTRGDVSDFGDEVEHQPQVAGDQSCICLVATDLPLRFTSLLGKIIQPITPF